MTQAAAISAESATSTVTEGAAVAPKSQKAAGAFRTISEVADDLGVPQHVLRFWETRFFQVRPLKRGGGRRYYRPEDVALIKKIHHLLYTEGYTIKGVQKLLKTMSKAQLLAEQGVSTSSAPAVADARAIATPAPANEQDVNEIIPAEALARVGLSDAQRVALQAALTELKSLRAEIKKAA